MAKKESKPEQAESGDCAPRAVRQAKFGKEKILGMARYANRTDLLSVLLKPGETYTLAAVDVAITDFMKGKVK